MPSETAKSAVAPKKWDQVLTKVRGMLDQTLARADARIEELDQSTNTKPNDRLARHLEGLEQRLQRAGVVVEQTDQALSNGEKTVREYMSSVDSLRQKLMDWVNEMG